MAKKEKDTKHLFGSTSAGSGFSLMILAYIVISLLGATILNKAGVTEESHPILYVSITSLFAILALTSIVLYYGLGRKENLFKTCTVKKFSPIYLLLTVLLAGGMF